MEHHFKNQLEVTEELTEELIEKFTGKKDFFDCELKPGHKMLFCMIQTEETPEQTAKFGSKINLKMVRITDESISVLEEEYEYVRHAGENEHLPIFTKIDD